MVPSDFSAVASPNVATQRVQGEQATSVKRGTNQVVRVGNILQVVPTTSLEWNARQASGATAQAPANIGAIMGPVPISMTHVKHITSPMMMHQIPRAPFVRPTLPLPVVQAPPVPPVPPVVREIPKKGKQIYYYFFNGFSWNFNVVF